ncbi:MAG: NHLP bacteriocin system secretion protein [Planctomycetota bacterium]
MNSQIFRQRAPTQPEPDRLDDLLRLVRPGSWLVLSTVAAFFLLALVWGIFGRLPITTEGNALLVYPRQVVSLYSPGNGQLVALNVRVGDRVEEGDVIGTLNLPDTERDLRAQRAELDSFLARNRTMSEMEREHAEKEKAHLQRQRQLTDERIAAIRTRDARLTERKATYNKQQRANLERTIDLSGGLGEALKQKLETYRALREEGLSNDDAVYGARSSYVDHQLRLADLALRMHELDLTEIDSEEAHTRRLDDIADLEVRAQDFALQIEKLEQQLVTGSLEDQTQVEQLRAEIARLEYVLETQGRIVADRPGRIIEISTSVGEFAQSGSRIGSIEIDDPDSALMVLAYFTVQDGKKVRAGMSARISPDTFERQRYGAIVATVESVSSYPVTREAVTNQIGNSETAQTLTEGGHGIELLLRLETDTEAESGYRWTSGHGPNTAITAGTTATARVTLEQRPPLTLLVPSLSAWLVGEE